MSKRNGGRKHKRYGGKKWPGGTDFKRQERQRKSRHVPDVCENCGNPVVYERLCLQCQRVLENKAKRAINDLFGM